MPDALLAADASARCARLRAEEYPQLGEAGSFLNAASYGPLPRSSLRTLEAYQA